MTTTITKRLIGLVATLALALGFTVATTAPASAASVWDRVAKCESGNRWHISTGNGYYGGLQFSSSTWRGYGGRKYASNAHKASKAEQIAIARRVLSGQGPGAWPTCSKRAGLTRANGKANRQATPASNPGSSKVSSKAGTSKKSSAKKSSSSDSRKKIRVKSGDTLGKIARRHDVKGGWKALYRLNKSKLRSPHNIQVGQVLRIQ